MLFMVVERFTHGTDKVGARFKEKGRMMPDGVVYVSSWVETSGARCFQLMEAPDQAALDGWIRNWSDIVDFEVTPVLSSADYWATKSQQT